MLMWRLLQKTLFNSPNKSDDLKNDEPNVGTSLDQQKKQPDDDGSPENELTHEKESEQEQVSGDKQRNRETD
jgi:hypothetical protein